MEALGVSRQRSIYRHVSLCACSICLHVHMYAYMHFYIWYRSVFVCVFQYVCMHACMYRSIYLLSTDFRAAGVLSLHVLLHFAERYPDRYSQVCACSLVSV